MEFFSDIVVNTNVKRWCEILTDAILGSEEDILIVSSDRQDGNQLGFVRTLITKLSLLLYKKVVIVVNSRRQESFFRSLITEKAGAKNLKDFIFVSRAEQLRGLKPTHLVISDADLIDNKMLHTVIEEGFISEVKTILCGIDQKMIHKSVWQSALNNPFYKTYKLSADNLKKKQIEEPEDICLEILKKMRTKREKELDEVFYSIIEIREALQELHLFS